MYVERCDRTSAINSYESIVISRKKKSSLENAL